MNALVSIMPELRYHPIMGATTIFHCLFFSFYSLLDGGEPPGKLTERWTDFALKDGTLH